jgi:tetratricopeptide (TPR) repeat protein
MQRPWLGWGPGRFRYAFQDHASPALGRILGAGNQFAEDPHQLLLAVACASGILGLAAMGLACMAGAGAVPRSPSALAHALGLGVAGLLLECQADRFLFEPGLLVPLCAALGILANRSVPDPIPAQLLPDPARRVSRSNPPAVMAASGASAIAGIFFAWQAVSMVRAFAQGSAPVLDAGVAALASGEDTPALRARALAGGGAADWERLGDSLAAQHRFAQAADALERSLALEPSRRRAQNLGNCRLMLGDAARAEQAFEKAVALEPSSSDAHFSLAYALFFERRLSESAREAQTALRLDPSNARASQLLLKLNH